MGSFSFTYADTNLLVGNVLAGARYKLLVPAVFGGGWVTQNYLDYGDVAYTYKGQTLECTLFGVLGAWNTPGAGGRDWMRAGRGSIYDPVGLELSLTAESMRALEFPLKLVSMGFTGVYEDCSGVSVPDEYQGVFGITPGAGVSLVEDDSGDLVGFTRDGVTYPAGPVLDDLCTPIAAAYHHGV